MPEAAFNVLATVVPVLIFATVMIIGPLWQSFSIYRVQSLLLLLETKKRLEVEQKLAVILARQVSQL